MVICLQYKWPWIRKNKHQIVSECLFFSCTLLKLACLITQLTCLITQLVCSSLYLIITGLLACARALTWVACIANTLWVLIAHYVFIRVRRVHYLSSSNSPVNIRIRNHICKGRGLILLMTGPAEINHFSANYTEFYFRYYLPFKMQYPISASCRRKHIKFCSSESDKDFLIEFKDTGWTSKNPT